MTDLLDRNTSLNAYLGDHADMSDIDDSPVLQPVLLLNHNNINLLDLFSQYYAFDEVLGKKDITDNIELFLYCQTIKKTIKIIVKEYTFCAFDVSSQYDDKECIPNDLFI